ncbi:MAG: transglutaminase-like cysteine peptidase [Deltaproteobacteria bacterium]|jgi:predicted transglutaminase-like cysteine proteinase|nr:transglutaminase-like cysteine peptidase [Deltaproteobacteria bacterium]
MPFPGPWDVRESARRVRDLRLWLACAVLCAACAAAFLAPEGLASRALAAQPGQLVLEKPPLDIDWDQYSAPDPPPRRASSPPSGGPAGGGSAKTQLRPDRLFGTVEFKSRLKSMPKWERVLRDYSGRAGLDASFGSNRQREAKAWEALKEKNKNASVLEKARAVNVFFNQWPYRTDQQVYGVSDYWATPDEFIKNSGDCEDYAITKMYALMQLGVDPANMRVVALHDNIRNLDHAVLALYTDDAVYILDNVTRLVLTHDNFMHYRPYFSVNGVFKWTHVPPK